MRTRLIVVFLVPLGVLLLVLGGAYAWTAARSVQQQFYAQQIGDLGYFVTSVRQALLSGSFTAFDGEAHRYQELYGTQVVAVDRSGRVLVASGEEPRVLDERTTAQVQLALSGRRGDLPEPVLPWQIAEQSLVEPVFDGGDVIGAVVMTASVEAPRAEIIRQWVLLTVFGVLAVALGLFIVFRLAGWVLRPLRRVDEAMEAIERGDMEARIADDTGPPEMHRMILLFNRMAGEIERVLSRQREFALNASHELRNPLNALLLRVENLATGLDESWEDDVEAAREEGRRMARILETLLAFARREGREPVTRAVDLSEIVARRARAWEDVAAEHGVSFLVRDDAPVLGRTDETIAEGALDAVIDNAVKFSPRGERIELWAERTEEGCEIVVRDHGPGLSEEERERATERFWRSPRDQGTAGSGLGLAIATDLLASIGGGIRVAGAEGGGLRVALSLPGEEA